MNCLALFCILAKSLPKEVVQSNTRIISALFLSSETVVELAGLNSVSLSHAPVLVCFGLARDKVVGPAAVEIGETLEQELVIGAL